MTMATHLMAGCIIGELTGQYPAALMGSVIVDADHLVSYLRHGVLVRPKLFIHTLISQEDPWDDQRNYFHTLPVWIAMTAGGFLIRYSAWPAFALSWAVHLVLDSLESSVLYPWYPVRQVNLRGPIGYASIREYILFVCLLLSYLYLTL